MATDIRREIHIAASPETVWSFFTDPELMVRWKGIRAELEARPGGLYRVDINGRGDVASGRYLELVPYRRLVFSWGWEAPGAKVRPGGSTVEVTFEPSAGGTLVRLVHRGLPDEEVAGHTEGWDHFLPRLATAASGRDAGPDPWAMGEEAAP